MEQRLTKRIDILDEKIDIVQLAIGDVIASMDESITDHERRIMKLETKIA